MEDLLGRERFDSGCAQLVQVLVVRAYVCKLGSTRDTPSHAPRCRHAAPPHTQVWRRIWRDLRSCLLTSLQVLESVCGTEAQPKPPPELIEERVQQALREPQP